jgi:SSS family transporter
MSLSSRAGRNGAGPIAKDARMETTGYVILGLYFAVLILIGLFCSRKQDSLSDYFLAGRSIPAWAALAAVVATETSAITFIGAPAMSFGAGGDLSFLQVALGYIIARVILSLYFLPRFLEGEIVTIYEFLGKRFGSLCQRCGGIFFFVTRALAAGVRHYAAALVISAITDFDLVTAIILTGIVSFLYSFLGGISAVIWTEVLQLIVMIIGGVLAFAALLHLIPGGLSHILDVAGQHNKLTMFHWDWSGTGAYSLIAGLLGGIFLSLASHGADQDLVQRLLSCRSLRGAQMAMIGSGIFVFFQFAFFLFIGVMLFVFYGSLPPGLEKTDKIFPYFISHNMSTTAAAIAIAAILSAALSSTASALNSLSSTAVNDFVAPRMKQSMSNKQMVLISRGFTLFWTVVLVGIALIARHSEYILETGLTIPSFTFGSLLAAFLLGIFTRLRSEKAVIIGMVEGVQVVIILWLLKIHWTWFISAGALSAMLTAYAVEWLEQKKSCG